MKIFIDDQAYTDRDGWVPKNWRRAVNFEEFKNLLEEAQKEGETIEAVSFDNDLGEGEKEGWEILQWLSENHPEMFRPEVSLEVHSANSEAAVRMRGKIKFWREHVDELIEAKERPDPWAELKVK